ncbi:MAG: Gfo/Idh/MocA family oxidoreductase [Candidatus Cloacimonetes bacterium]|nr:Gfo/Idh/MocA family oxidoreductase [Candidatus Cloacimonadota bacterium]
MNVCIIGVGYWGPNLVRNFLSCSLVDLVYCYDKDSEKLNSIKQKFPSVVLINSWDELLDDKSITAVAIATPVSTHYDLAKQCLLADKHVLLEKPMAHSYQEAIELTELAKSKQLILLIDHIFIYTSAVQKMKELVNSGEIGEINYFDSTRINLGLFQHDVNVIWDLAPHDLSIMLYLMDKHPVAVFATGVDHLNNGLEDIAYLTLYFEDKTIAHFHLSWISPVKVRKMIVGGSKKMIVYDDMMSDEKIKIYDKGFDVLDEEVKNECLVQYRIGDIHVPTLLNSEALTIEVNHFIDCCVNGSQPMTCGAQGALVVKILEAAQESIKVNQKVSL